MSNKPFYFLLFLCCLVLSLSCKKSPNTCHWAAEPPVFFFQIKRNNHVLPDSVLSRLQLSYFSGGSKKYVSDLSIATDSSGVVTSRQIGTFENQVFYLEYFNKFSSDTLFVSNSMPTPATNCNFATKQVKFNNLEVSATPNYLNYYNLYVFNKQ